MRRDFLPLMTEGSVKHRAVSAVESRADSVSYFPEPMRTRFLRAERWFIVISGTVLWATACAKLISALLGQTILKLRDPVLSIPNRELLLLVAACEFVGSAYCLFGQRRVRKLMVVNFLSAGMLVYRVLRKATGFAGYDCPCLGTFPQWLPLDRGSLELVLKGLMGFMLAFSSAFLLARVVPLLRMRRRRRNKLAPADSPGGEGVE